MHQRLRRSGRGEWLWKVLHLISRQIFLCAVNVVKRKANTLLCASYTLSSPETRQMFHGNAHGEEEHFFLLTTVIVTSCIFFLVGDNFYASTIILLDNGHR